MPSLESTTETVICAILNAAGLSLTAVPKETQATPSNSQKDRIVVNCGPREVELYTASSNLVAIYRLMVKIEVVYVTRNVTTYDAIIAGIEAAMGAAEPPGAALALWVAAFPYGARIEQTSEGDDETAGNTRERTRSFRVFANTGAT